MRKLTALMVAIGALAALPTPALAGGSGYAACPSGLIAQPFAPESPTELTAAKKPLTIEGVVLIPHHVAARGTGREEARYNYAWGTDEPGTATATILLCGVKAHTGLSESDWILIAIGGFILGFGIMFALAYWGNPRNPKAPGSTIYRR